jgi:chemotaxis response regulator CheB
MKEENRGRKRRVLVIGDCSLLSAGLLSLLSHEIGLEVAGLRPSESLRLIEEVEHFQPDVVVFDHAARIAVIAALMDLHLDRCALTVVEVNAEQTMAQMYERRPVVITDFSELLALILRG